MADLTTEEIAGIRAIAEEAGPLGVVCTVFGDRERLFALLDMAERCAKAEAERDCFESQCDYYKADLDAIRSMLPNVEGVCTQDLVRDRLKALEAKAASYDKLCASQREQWSSLTRDIVRGQNKQEEA